MRAIKLIWNGNNEAFAGSILWARIYPYCWGNYNGKDKIIKYEIEIQGTVKGESKNINSLKGFAQAQLNAFWKEITSKKGDK